MDNNLEVKINICLADKVSSANRTKILLAKNKDNGKFWA